MSTKRAIKFFTKNDEYFELSNFYPQGFEEDGVYWSSIEHYFQAMKFVGEENANHRERIRKAHSPKQAKALGHSRKHTLRSDWESAKEGIMLNALRRKFAHPKLSALLVSTGKRRLEENSPYDRYWGVGRDGRGKNRLGVLLMQVRKELGEKSSSSLS
jgi:N-glycosidase YbiA